MYNLWINNSHEVWLLTLTCSLFMCKNLPGLILQDYIGFTGSTSMQQFVMSIRCRIIHRIECTKCYIWVYINGEIVDRSVSDSCASDVFVFPLLSYRFSNHCHRQLPVRFFTCNTHRHTPSLSLYLSLSLVKPPKLSWLLTIKFCICIWCSDF